MIPGARYVFVARVAYASQQDQLGVEIVFSVQVGPALPPQVTMFVPPVIDPSCPLVLRAEATPNKLTLCSGANNRRLSDLFSTNTTTTKTTTDPRFNPAQYVQEAELLGKKPDLENITD